MKVPHYLKQFGGWVIGLRDKARYDLFWRTTALIVVAQIVSALVMLGIFWWALEYSQSSLIDGIADYIVELVRSYPAAPNEEFSTVANRVKTEGILIVLFGMAGLSAAFGYMLANVTLRPARAALRYQKRFIGNVAHELRTPLSVIKTQTEVALLDPGLPREVKETFDETIRELDRISEIINNLLSFNTLIRPERMEFGRVDLRGIIEKVVKAHAPLADKNGVSIQTSIQARIVKGNETALEQVVGNLVKNAIYYTPKAKGGVVTVRTYLNSEEGIVFEVEDTGIGIPSEELYHIFDPFYRGDSSRARGLGGTSGLGLAIVNEIVRIHQGKILVVSAINQGTKVSVVLPRAASSGEKISVHVPEEVAPANPAFNEVSHDFSKGL